MEKKDKIVGIVYAYDTGEEYAMVKELGIAWIRINVAFPWADRMHGQLSEPYLYSKDEIARAYKNGMRVMPCTPTMGEFKFNKEEGKTRWHDAFPDFVGEKGTQEYYDNVRAAMKFICEDLGGTVGHIWQCMNEIDIETFAKDYTDEVLAGTARATAEGIVQGNPAAMCGTTIASYFHDHAMELLDLIHQSGHHMAYIGVDGYFGTWGGKTVEAWTEVIDGLYAQYKLPVLVNEWGYSSGGGVTDKRPAPGETPEGWSDVCLHKDWFHAVPGGHTPQVQGEYLRRGLELFANHPHVLGSFMFCWRDAHKCWHCGQTECPAECFWGLVDRHCKPKASYYAVKEAIAKYYR